MSASPSRLEIILFLVLLAGGLLREPPWRGYSPNQRIEVTTEPLRIAQNLQLRSEFGNPFGAMPTGPTAHVAPGMPFLVWGLMKWTGLGSAGWLAIRFLASIALSLQYALLPWASRCMGFSTMAGFTAAVFGILSKPALEEKWEAHLSGLLVLLLTTSAVICTQRGWPVNLRITFGVLVSLAIYVQPVILVPMLACTAWQAYSSSPVIRRRLLWAWMVPLLALLPWTIRNRILLGGFVPIRDNFGIELYVSFNDCAPVGFSESLRTGCISKLHPNSSSVEAAELKDQGEYRYNQERLRTARAWILAHPQRSWTLIAGRIWNFWFPGLGEQRQMPPSSRALFRGALTALSLGGLYLGFRKTPISASLLISLTIFYPLVYYLIQFEPRYRYPILWTTWLLAAIALTGVLRMAARRARRGPS